MSTRPPRNAPAPRPSVNAFYCHTCGRVISPRKSHTTQSTPQKYCSVRCRREKPRPGPSTEADIEMAFVRLLGDGREKRVVNFEEVERIVFMTRRRTEEEDDEDDEDERKGPINAAGKGEEGEDGEGDEPEDEDGGVSIPCDTEHPAATSTTSINTTMRPTAEKAADTTPRERGMQKAKERETVRRAARRGVAFGFGIGEGKKKRVEAVQGGRVVESSFAKGEWGVRWRE